MKTPEEVKEILIDSIEKVRADGWRLSEVQFLVRISKLCCPLMAVAIAHGYDPNGEDDSENPWVKILDDMFGEDWDEIWKGYDDYRMKYKGNSIFRKIGQEIRQLYPPEVLF